MNKTAIKKFAIWARVNLMESAKQRAYEYEITENGTNNSNADIIGGRPLSKDEKDQRRQLIEQINAKGFNQVMEEAAYTWFNRFIALRYMEVNGYLPTRIRVFTNEEGEFKPEILKEAMIVELDGIDRDKILDLLDKQDNEALYKMLLIAQCNSLSEGLPYMFEKIANWTELLFPANLLKADSVIGQMVTVIPEEDWTDAVQIIGWLYQYYNSELKDETFALLKKNVKITKERIPAATQLFTPDWIVRYMVENSLGRIYIQRKLVNSGEWLVADEATKVSMEKKEAEEMGWKYYLPEAEQESEVRKQLMQISNTYTGMKVEDIKVIDPCMGSGHILVYAFDVLMQIYTASGWSERDAAKSIIENNIYGLDIDDRAGQLAYFAVMMKARKYNRRILNGRNRPNVMAIQDSAFMTDDLIEYVAAGNKDIRASLNAIRAVFKDAKEYGSILEVKPVDTAAIYQRIEEIEASTPEDIFAMINKDLTTTKLFVLVKQNEIMSQKYCVVTTNPPYMGGRSFSNKMSAYVQKYYSEAKQDLFAVCIQRCLNMSLKNGFISMITMHSFMFLSAFEDMRKNFLKNNISSMVHLGIKAFDEIGNDVVQTVAYVVRKNDMPEYESTFCRLVDCKDQELKQKEFLARRHMLTGKVSDFLRIPGNSMAYWVSEEFISNFEKYPALSSVITMSALNKTGDNETYLRNWWEVNIERIGEKWRFYSKGGNFRRYYGNLQDIIDWSDEARDFYKSNKTSNLLNEIYWYKEGITYSAVTSRGTGFRYLPVGCVYDMGGPAIFVNNDHLLGVLALLNSSVSTYYFNVLNPSINLQTKDIKTLPFIVDGIEDVECLAENNRKLAEADWNSNETSRDFLGLNLRGVSVEENYKFVCENCEKEANQFEANMRTIDAIFAEKYGLCIDELPELEARDNAISIPTEIAWIKKLISYAVGCIFGRFSLDLDGIVYAGGKWEKHESKFKIDSDNIIPICDDEYFDDDIVSKFSEFIELVYGSDNIESNLAYIAKVLGGKGSARDVIRNYFLTDFYTDHCSMYSAGMSGKRPIYWLFDSGKKNGFKCLIYMHRYQPDTVARIRTDYIHELQSRYRTAIADLEDRVEHAAAGDKVKLNKQLAKIKDQELELRLYEEKIHHLADQMISIDLDDGVKVNYAKFGDVLAKIK